MKRIVLLLRRQELTHGGGSVRQQPSSEVWQEPEPPGDPTRHLFLPRGAIRALVELGGSKDKIHTMNWIRRAAS